MPYLKVQKPPVDKALVTHLAVFKHTLVLNQSPDETKSGKMGEAQLYEEVDVRNDYMCKDPEELSY